MENEKRKTLEILILAEGKISTQILINDRRSRRIRT